ADWEFHQTFFEHAGNRYLLDMVENLRTYTHRMRQTWTGGPEAFDGRAALDEHGKILEKVQQHHYDGALQALDAHLKGVLARSLPQDPAVPSEPCPVTPQGRQKIRVSACADPNFLATHRSGGRDLGLLLAGPAGGEVLAVPHLDDAPD